MFRTNDRLLLQLPVGFTALLLEKWFFPVRYQRSLVCEYSRVVLMSWRIQTLPLPTMPEQVKKGVLTSVFQDFQMKIDILSGSCVLLKHNSWNQFEDKRLNVKNLQYEGKKWFYLCIYIYIYSDQRISGFCKAFNLLKCINHKINICQTFLRML